jgi:hypothetical protein
MTDVNEGARGGHGAGQDATVGELARQLPEQISQLVREELQQAMPPVPRQAQASVEADVEEIKERVQR